MSDEEGHSEREFYYSKDEEQAETEQNNMSKVITHEDENFGNSQEELQKFVQEQKSENTVKKSSSYMKCFYRFLAEINKTNVQILDLPSEEKCCKPNVKTSLCKAKATVPMRLAR